MKCLSSYYFIAMFLFLHVIATVQSQPLKTELLTSYDVMIQKITDADSQSGLIQAKYFAVTKEGRQIPYLEISQNSYGQNPGKIKVMIFANQHGNEQSGKEGALILISEIANGNLNYLFDKIDLILIPNMNPDGTEKDQRRNSNEMDLNRNHVILTEQETAGLHKLFNTYLPESTLDVHEYSPYSKSWIDYGYIKQFDEQFGTLTNPNISEKMRSFQKSIFLPFIEKFLVQNGFTFNEYVLEGPPNISRMRYSTVDVNDGRQGFGILGTFSFIVEGLNGKESVDNISHRALGQFNALKGYLDFIYNNKDEIKKLVGESRLQLKNSGAGDPAVIRMDHVKGDAPVKLNLLSLSTMQDTQVIVNDFHSLVEPHLTVSKPIGYLVPKSDSTLTELIMKHNWAYKEFSMLNEQKVFQYEIDSIGTEYMEGEDILFPHAAKKNTVIIDPDYYLFIPIDQLASDLIVTALEPESMWGLIQYKEFRYLLEGSLYPILRVE